MSRELRELLRKNLENYSEEILFEKYATPLQSEMQYLLDLVTFVITDIYLRGIGLCKPLSPRLCFSLKIPIFNLIE